MKVLFIGGTGTISTAASELAVRKGMELYLLNRGGRMDRVPQGAKLIKGDIREPEAVAEALKGMEFDAVVDWIAFVPEHIENDIKLFSGRTAQYVFISSASAYQKPPAHYLITEATPLCNPYWQYSRDKIACEERLMQEYRLNGFPVTIVRPSYTYNEATIPYAFNSRKARWTIVDRMLRGERVIVPGDGNSLWTMTHSRDFAKGFTGLLGNVQAIGSAFHITSDEVLTWDQIIKIIGRAAGVEPVIEHIPSDFIGIFSPEHIGGLLGDKSVSVVFDNTRIKRLVPDFSANISFREGIAECVSWFKADSSRCSVDEEFNLLADRIISAYRKGL